MKDRAALAEGRQSDILGRYVFPDDAEDIRAHRWFRNLPWDQLQTLTPPFVPRITSPEDTHYFDESDPLEDWSESAASPADLSPEDIKSILHNFRSGVQAMAVELLRNSYDSAKLREVDTKIETTQKLASEEKQVLKHFVRLYGRKEPKRARDKLLRDPQTKDVVMDVRKKTAFMGYSWQRMKPGGYTVTTPAGTGDPHGDST